MEEVKFPGWKGKEIQATLLAEEPLASDDPERNSHFGGMYGPCYVLIAPADDPTAMCMETTLIGLNGLKINI